MAAHGRAAAVVLFDLGGVVVDVNIDHGRRRWAELTGDAQGFDRAFFDTGAKDRMDVGQSSADAGLAAALDATGGVLSAAQAADCWNAVLAIRPEVCALVREVATRARCAVLSNTDPVHAAWIETHAGIRDAIETWIYSFDVGGMKPEAPIFHAALARVGEPAERVVLIDDRADNVAAARALGLDAILWTDLPSVRRALAERGLAAP